MTKHTCLIFLLVILLTGCKKDKLPEPTLDGKNTFGCLVNGKLFREASGLSSPGSLGLSVQYYAIKKGNQENILSIGTPGKIDDIESPYMGFGVIGLAIEKGKTYILAAADDKSGGAARYRFGAVNNSSEYLTSSSQKGELYIPRIDDKGISGTFWFDAISKTGQKAEIRDGRFDVNF